MSRNLGLFAALILTLSAGSAIAQDHPPTWVKASIEGGPTVAWQAHPDTLPEKGSTSIYKNHVGDSTLVIESSDWTRENYNEVTLTLEVTATDTTMILLHPGTSLVTHGKTVTCSKDFKFLYLDKGEKGLIVLRGNSHGFVPSTDALKKGWFSRATSEEAWNQKKG